MSDADPTKLDVSSTSAPVNVPVFNCVVYLSHQDGQVHARVANLHGLELVGSDERDALTRTVTAFKEQVRSAMESKTEIDWIDPIPEPTEGEQRRFIPVHL